MTLTTRDDCDMFAIKGYTDILYTNEFCDMFAIKGYTDILYTNEFCDRFEMMVLWMIFTRVTAVFDEVTVNLLIYLKTLDAVDIGTITFLPIDLIRVDVVLPEEITVLVIILSRMIGALVNPSRYLMICLLILEVVDRATTIDLPMTLPIIDTVAKDVVMKT